MPGPRLTPVRPQPSEPPRVYPSLPATLPSPAAPTTPFQPISHQAAGVDLGCTGCVFDGIQFKDVAAKTIPLWAKVLGGMAALAAVVWITAALARRG